MNIVGIDPGANGAVAVINERLEVLLMVDMPKENKTFVDVIKSHSGVFHSTYIEQVHAMPGQGVTSMFTFGVNYGKAELLAESFGNVKYVRPAEWKKALGLKRIDGESKTDYKHRSVEKARELFPEVADRLKISKDGRAEALLIAYYGLVKENCLEVVNYFK